jgi:hypothetical protein
MRTPSALVIPLVGNTVVIPVNCTVDIPVLIPTRIIPAWTPIEQLVIRPTGLVEPTTVRTEENESITTREDVLRRDTDGPNHPIVESSEILSKLSVQMVIASDLVTPVWTSGITDVV